VPGRVDTLNCEEPEIDDEVILAKNTGEDRLEKNNVRPLEAIAWNQPREVHRGLSDPKIPDL
jgi:putative transposase